MPDVLDEQTTTETAPEEPAQPEQTDAEADADFAAGFGSDETTPPTEPAAASPEIVDPDATAAPAAVVPDPVPQVEFVQLTKDEHRQLTESASKVAEIEAALARLSSTANGKFGGLERTIAELRAATPKGQAIEVSAADFEELKAEFPDLAELHVKGLNRVLSKFKGTGSPEFDATELATRIKNEVAQVKTEVAQEAAVQVLDLTVKDWRQTVHSPEYTAWMNSQGEQYRQHMASTWNPADVHQSINLFKAQHKPKPPAPAPADARRNRLAAAVVAPSSGGRSAGKTDDDDFLAGFNGG